MNGKLIVIVAPSGTGKSTLIKRLKKEVPRIEESISFTTRPRRTGEVNGEAYFFIRKDEFESMIEKNEFLEYAQVHSNYYGTSKRFVSDGYALGKWLLFDLDVQGCDSMKEAFPQAKIIFIEPPSIAALETRLRGRATDKPEVIEERLKNARYEMTRKNDYDYLIMNDDIDTCYDKLKGIITEITESAE